MIWRFSPKVRQDADVVQPIDLENAYGRAFRSTCLEAARIAYPQLAAIRVAQWELCDTNSGSDVTMVGR